MYRQQILLLLRYNKDVNCVIDQGKQPVCAALESARRNNDENTNLPSHDPYIPRNYSIFYNCSGPYECKQIYLNSISQVASPNLNLKACYYHSEKDNQCDKVRYNHFKNIDKLLFLNQNVDRGNKKYYMVDCLIYTEGARVCQRKNESAYGKTAHVEVIDLGKIVRPSDNNILSQDEFICEENLKREVTCDLNALVTYKDSYLYKDTANIIGDVLLKSESYVIPLKYVCENEWCGYTGSAHVKSRRSALYPYEVPGGKVYRCFYAKKQQICKEIHGAAREVYNQRDLYHHGN